MSHEHDATRRPQSRFAAGLLTQTVPLSHVDDEDAIEMVEVPPITKPIDAVHNPRHYTQHPSGVECIQITEHMGFNLGNALKYIWRADLKGNAIEDLRKARWYIEREIAKRIKGNV